MYIYMFYPVFSGILHERGLQTILVHYIARNKCLHQAYFCVQLVQISHAYTIEQLIYFYVQPGLLDYSPLKDSAFLFAHVHTLLLLFTAHH